MKITRLLAIFALLSLATAQQSTPQHKPTTTTHSTKAKPKPKPRATGPYSKTGGKATSPSAYTRFGTGTFVPPVTFSGDLSGNTASQQVIGILGQPLPALSSPGYIHWNGTAWVFDNPSGGTGGGMTWPASAGIANYSGTSSTGWNTSYSTSNPIPPGYNQILSLAGGSSATPAVGFFAAPDVGIFAGPMANLGGAAQGIPLASLTRTSNVVTATSSLATIGGLTVGGTISISGVTTDTSFNGKFTIASIASPSFTYNQTGANASVTNQGIASPWVVFATGYALEFNRLQSSTSNAALRGSIRFGPSDSILYGCVSCGNSIVTGFGTTDQNLLKANGSSGPVQLGDTMGVFVPGNLQTNITSSGAVCVHAIGGVLSSAGADCNSGGTGGSMTWPTGGAGIPFYSGTSAWGTTFDNVSNLIPAGYVAGTVGNAATATSLASNGTANQFWGMGSGTPTQGWYTLPSGGGTVSSGTSPHFAYYAASGTTVSSNPRLTDDPTNGLSYGGNAYFTGNLKIDGVLQVKGPWLVNSIVPTVGMGPAPSGPPAQSSFGISNDGNFYISALAGTPYKICTNGNGPCGGANTAVALATAPGTCGTGSYPAGFPTGVDASGNPVGCTALGSISYPTSTGIAYYDTGAGNWGPSFNASNTILPSYIPILNQSTTGNAATATAFAATPTQCATNSYTSGIIANGNAQHCVSIGNGLAVTGGVLTTTNAQPYEIGITVNGLFAPSQVFLRKPSSIAYTIPSGCTNSQVILGTATTASLTITLSKNGTSFATAVIAAGTTGGNTNTTWTCTTPTSFSIGSPSVNSDVLTITAPSTADTAAAGLGATIYATR